MGQRAAYEDTDFVPCDRAGWDTTVLERLVSAFEEQAMAASMDLAPLAVMLKKGRVEGCDAFMKEVRALDVELG